MNKKVLLVTLVAAIAVAGCSKKSRRSDDSYDSRGSSSSSSGPSGGVTGDVYGGSGAAGQDGGAGAGAMPSANVFYFEFDSSELKPEGQALVDAWGAYLAANPGTKVRLEGHADERGTREYNVALGERRANNVLQALTSRGVSAQQVSVSSFGEERPVAMGHDEASWAQNRRVEVVQ